MKLTLISDDGILLNQWDVDKDFGDLTMPLPQKDMTNDIVNEILKEKEKNK